ncbi:Hypothetical protein CM240_3049 [Clostridium bornimense]|uniref:Cxxc_20_cxxc protein n=1 Tax=Clostridium bornimense TaxID=1216932 RepID=W6RZS8_9CLOT|nr:hypothetical protein [Clostridium bornimense]CDM70166.1 Hypothetical protein CM240_3049 [Clostridium bornimense]
MKYCPHCNNKLKLFSKESFNVTRSYALKCDKCNNKFSHTLLTDRYNTISTVFFFSIILVFFDDIQYYINLLVHNNFTANVIIFCLVLIGFIIINNFNFPWTRYEATYEKEINKASTS